MTRSFIGMKKKKMLKYWRSEGHFSHQVSCSIPKFYLYQQLCETRFIDAKNTICQQAISLICGSGACQVEKSIKNSAESLFCPCWQQRYLVWLQLLELKKNSEANFCQVAWKPGGATFPKRIQELRFHLISLQRKLRPGYLLLIFHFTKHEFSNVFNLQIGTY